MTEAALPLCTRGNYSNCRCKVLPTVTETGYGSQWHARVAAETGTHYMKVDGARHSASVLLAEQHKRRVVVGKGRSPISTAVLETDAAATPLNSATGDGPQSTSSSTSLALSFFAGVVSTLLVVTLSSRPAKPSRDGDTAERAFHLMADAGTPT